MPWFFGVALLGANTWLLFRRLEVGLVVYFTLSLVAPQVHMGGLVVSYEILAAPVIVLFTLLLRRFTVRPYHFLLVAVLAILFYATLVSEMRLPSPINWVALSGVIRSFVLLAILVDAMPARAVERVLAIAISINAVTAAIQLTIPSSVSVFYRLYFKEAHAPLGRYFEWGFFTRATGTFGSPVYLGGLALIALAVFGTQALEWRRNRTSLVLTGAALMAGIASLSKTFLLGAPLVVLFALLVVARRRWHQLP